MLKYLCSIGVIAALFNIIVYLHMGYSYVVNGYGLHPAVCAAVITAMIMCIIYCYTKARS